MDRQITLNETQVKLLKEYVEAEARFQHVANRVEMVSYSHDEYDSICKEFEQSFQAYRQAASCFASSVAEGLK